MQQAIVIIIGIITLFFIGRGIYKLFTRKPGEAGKCAGCDIDCALRDVNPKDCKEKEK